MKILKLLLLQFLTGYILAQGFPPDNINFDEILKTPDYEITSLYDEVLSNSKGDFENLSSNFSNLVTNFIIEGEWDSSYWHDGVHLLIKKVEANKYEVLYFARGDLDSWLIKRTAFFKNGVLELNKPVEEYMPLGTYKHFYLLKLNEGVRLISQPLARFILKKEDFIDEFRLKKKEKNRDS